MLICVAMKKEKLIVTLMEFDLNAFFTHLLSATLKAHLASEKLSFIFLKKYLLQFKKYTYLPYK
jgi:hypothetical protein